MATATKNPKIEYMIDSRLIDELYKVRKKMKCDRGYGARVAALCLLGEKDGVIDSFVPMLSKDGCWDSPQISYGEFEKAFLKMVKKDRAVMGMALIRPNGYSSNLPGDFRRNIRNWKHAFKDIYSTIWIVVSQQDVIPYVVTKDSAGRIQFKECRGNIFVAPEHSKMLKIAEMKRKMRHLTPSDTEKMREYLSKYAKTVSGGTSGAQILKNIELEKEVIESKRMERLKKIKKQRDERRKQRKANEERFKKQEENRKKKEKQEKAGMKDTIDIGGGYFLIKQKNGREILWKK